MARGKKLQQEVIVREDYTLDIKSCIELSEKAKQNFTLQMWARQGILETNLKLIESMAGRGISLRNMAHSLGISEGTLTRIAKLHPQIQKVIDNGRELVVANCQSALMKAVGDGNVSAIIYALKVFGGDFWNDKYNARQLEKMDEIQNNLTTLINTINAPSQVVDDNDDDDDDGKVVDVEPN